MGLGKWFRKNRAMALYNRGTMLAIRGDFADAVVLLEKTVNMMPDWADAHHNLGNALMGLYVYGNNAWTGGRLPTQYEKALAAFDQALALRINFPEAHNNRGRALIMLNRYAEALEAFDTAIELRPDYIKARTNRKMCEQLMLGHEPISVIPEEVPWLWQLVLEHSLDYYQASRVVSLFIRQERLLAEGLDVTIEEYRYSQNADPQVISNLTRHILERPDYREKLINLDGKSQEKLIDIVLSNADHL